MNHNKTENLDTSVGELANLMNDTFTCCMRNYEALLPYLEKKETKLKIYHKLVHINVLLNKLNEELVGLRVEYVTVSSYEAESETVLSEGGTKRKICDVFDVGRHKTKSMKTEESLSSSISCSTASTSDTQINVQSSNLISTDTEDTKCTQMQRLDMGRTQNIKTEMQDSNKIDLLVFPIGDNDIPAAQTSCDTRNNRVTACFVGDTESASMGDRLRRDSAYNKPTDTSAQSEKSKEHVSLENFECVTSNQDKYEDIGSVRGQGGEVDYTTPFSSSCQPKRPINNKECPVVSTTCGKGSATLIRKKANSCNKEERRAAHSPIRYENDQIPARRSEELFFPGDELYGVIRYENGKLKCVLCSCKLPNYLAVEDHVYGMRHKKKATVNQSIRAKKPDILDNNCESSASVSLCASVSCSLADTVTIVEKGCQLESTEHAVDLDDIWKYVTAPFQINRKYFQFHSGQLICTLCNLHVKEYVLSMKIHISRSSHVKRIKRLTNFEIAWKSKNKGMLTVPGILNKCLPKTQFTLQKDGFFCKVCQQSCENYTVLSHLTSKSHSKKLHKLKEIVNV